jgi:type I restriction enzyme R subunit
MMTTGYDCQDILNLCLMRPIFSPTDFIQIKGRGTRLWKFTLSDGSGTPVVRTKERFKLFDFFANCEYFEQKYNYDEVLKLPRVGISKEPGSEPIFIDGGASEFTIYNPDPLKHLTQTPVGLEGMKVDWKLFEKARDTIRADVEIERAMSDDRLDLAASLARDHFENRPELYLTLEKLKEAEKLDRRLTWREVVERIFGRIDHFRTKDELLDDEYANFIAVTPNKPNALQAAAIRNFMKAYITDPHIRAVIESKDYGQLVTNPKVNMQDLKDLNGYLTAIPEYVKDYVALNTYM